MPAMANPHRDPTPMNTVVEDSDQNFVDGLIKKTPAELQAIGLNKLRSRCLISLSQLSPIIPMYKSRQLLHFP